MTKNQKLIKWVEEIAALTKPDSIHWCDGSAAENQALCDLLVKAGTFKPLPKRPGSYACNSHPSDVARSEGFARTACSRQQCSHPSRALRCRKPLAVFATQDE